MHDEKAAMNECEQSLANKNIDPTANPLGQQAASPGEYVENSGLCFDSISREVWNALDDGICLVDADLKIADFNKAFRSLFADAETAVDCRRSLGSLSDDIQAFLAPTSADLGPVKVQVQRDGGRRVWAEVCVRQIGAGKGYLLIVKDISMLVEAEAEVEQTVDDVTLLNSIIGVLGRSFTFTDVLTGVKSALSASKDLTGGRLLVCEPINDLLWQAVAWGVCSEMIFQPVSLADYYNQYVADETSAAHAGVVQQTSDNETLCCVPMVTETGLLGLLELFSDLPGQFDQRRRKFYRLLGQQIGMAILHVRLYEEVKASREKLKNLSANLVSAVEAERISLARDLHDEVGQALLALQLAIGLSSKHNGNQDDQEIKKQQSMVSDLTSRIRGLITDMRPGVLEEKGLVGGIEWIINRLAKVTDIGFSFEYGCLRQVRFVPEVETVFFRIAQEALNNVIKHAKASVATISLEYRAGTVILSITDDGQGFDVDSKLAGTKHFGLVGIRERIEAINGTLNIDSSVRTGTRLVIAAAAAQV